jgi:PAS domain S-box-containing protein
LSRALPVRNKRGEIVEWYGIAADIEDRKRAQEAERRHESELRELIEAIPAMAWSASPDSSCTYVNKNWTEYTGLSLEETVGSGWLRAVHQQDAEQHLSSWQKSVATGQPFQNEVRFRRAADGQYRWFTVRGVPLLDEQGRILRWYGIAADIEDRKRAEQAREEAARRSERELRDVVNTVPAYVWSTTPDGQVDFVNDRWLQFTGLALDEAFGWKWEAVLHPDDRTRVVADWHTAVKNGQAMESEARVRQADGEYCWWFVRNVPLRDETGKLVRWYGTAIDIEERKRAEQALRRSEAYLAEAQRLTKTGSWAAQVSLKENVNWSNVYWSKEMYRIFGFDPDPTPPSSMEVVRRLHPEDAPYHPRMVERAIRDGTDFELDYRLLLPDGAAKYIHAVGHPVVNASGDVIELVGTAMDVTERKRAEDALHASEASLLEAQRLTRTCSWRHEVLSDKVTVSPEGLLMYGIEPEDDASSADFYFGRMHPKDRPEVQQAYAAALLRKTDFEADFRIVLPDGTIKNTRSIGHPILDERGDVVEFVGASIDVTEHHRAAQALRRSEAYLAEAQKLTKTGSWARDPRADLILYCSDEIYRIFGLNPADGIPSTETLMQRVHPDDRTRIRARIEEGVRDKVERSFEYRIMLPDGNVKYLHHLRRPVINDAGEVVEVLGTTMDITERKQAEEAKKAAEELASSHVEVMMRSLDVLAKEPAPEKYIAEILRTIAQHLRAHRVMLWLREQNDDSLRLHTVILNDKPIVTDETDHPFVRTSSSWKQIPFLTGMLATKSTAVCEDVEDDSRLTSEWRKYLTSRKTKRLVSVPMFLAGEFRGFISIHHSEAGTYRPDEIELAQSLAQHVMMAVHGQQVAEQERQAAILKERARLARDVHDTLAQGFTGVILQMEAAEEALFDENPDAAVQRVRRAREIARESLGEARRSVHALRPQALDKSGFAEALQSMLKNTTAGTSLRTSFCSEGEPMVLPANVEETLLRIGQEALSNALKHAHPTEFHIRLCFKSDAVRLEFFDNGKGFVVGQTNGGVGLLGMKERAEQIGATLTISSEPGKGTKIIAVSPNKVETASS